MATLDLSIHPQFLPAIQDFLHKEFDGQTDQDIANDLLELILELARVRENVNSLTPDATKLFDQVTLSRLNRFDSDDPNLAVFEKVLHRLIHCDGERGIVYLKDSIRLKQQQISAEQSRRASTPRDEHPLKTVLREIINQDPNLRAKEYLNKLIVYVEEKGRGMAVICRYCSTDNAFLYEDQTINTITSSTVERKWVSEIKNEYSL